MVPVHIHTYAQVEAYYEAFFPFTSTRLAYGPASLAGNGSPTGLDKGATLPSDDGSHSGWDTPYALISSPTEPTSGVSESPDVPRMNADRGGIESRESIAVGRAARARSGSPDRGVASGPSRVGFGGRGKLERIVEAFSHLLTLTL